MKKYRDQPFKTPSGKVEFFSRRLAEAGFCGVPFANGLGPNPIAFSEQSDDYPVLGVSGARDIRFTNSQYRTIPALLKAGAGAVVDIHPQDAKLWNFAEGDTLEIATPKGAIEMIARLSTTVRPGMVRLAWGWGDYQAKANLNSLTEDDIRGPVSGTSTSRSFMCRLRKL